MNRYEALKHAVRAHAGQVDKCGQPYILHPIAVAEVLEPLTTIQAAPDDAYQDAVVVALLHDVLEDTSYQIPSEALTGIQARALVALTRQTEREPHPETYAEYIERICEGGEIAHLVKLADLRHNMSPSRMDCLPAKEAASLLPRYLKARGRIWKALGYEWWPEQEATAEGVFV